MAWKNGDKRWQARKKANPVCKKRSMFRTIDFICECGWDDSRWVTWIDRYTAAVCYPGHDDAPDTITVPLPFLLYPWQSIPVHTQTPPTPILPWQSRCAPKLLHKEMTSECISVFVFTPRHRHSVEISKFSCIFHALEINLVWLRMALAFLPHGVGHAYSLFFYLRQWAINLFEHAKPTKNRTGMPLQPMQSYAFPWKKFAPQMNIHIRDKTTELNF